MYMFFMFRFVYRVIIPIIITCVTAIEFFDKRATTDITKYPVLGEKTFVLFVFMTFWSWIQMSILSDEGQDDRVRARNIIKLIYFVGLIAMIVVWKNNLYMY